MKNILIIIVGLFILNARGVDAETIHATNFGYFYVNLSPYGTWIEIDNGVYIWKPERINNVWQPYSDGKWIYTDDGWYWESYENFGYITYHYGRWYYDSFYGWVWYPGYEWAPSWVEWRYDDDYIGWAPLPPYAAFQHDRGIVFSISWNAPINYWYFVRIKHFYNDNLSTCGIPINYKKVLFRDTKTRNNYQFVNSKIRNIGVNTDFIESRTGRSVIRRRIVETNTLERQINKDEVKRYIPDDNELRKYSGITKYETEVSRGKSSLKLDRIVDDNYSIDKSSNNYQQGSKRERIYVKRDLVRNNNNSNSDTKKEEVVRDNNSLNRGTTEYSNCSPFENRKNYEHRDLTSSNETRSNNNSEDNRNYQSRQKETSRNSTGVQNSSTKSNQTKERTREKSTR